MAQAVGHPVRIAIDEERIYPPPDGAAATGAASTAIVLAIMTVGIFVVPYLIVQERQTRTLDALLISPATVWQIVAGKALAGSVYCLLVAVIAAAFHQRFIVHWGAAGLVVLCGAFFAVGAGVLLGSLFELPQHVNALGGLLLVVLTIAMYMADRATRLPGVVSAVLPHLPSVALGDALKLAFAEVVSGTALWARLTKVLFLSVVAYGVAGWQIKRSDR
jgi:ABC-2 type transport system permease protein